MKQWKIGKWIEIQQKNVKEKKNASIIWEKAELKNTKSEKEDKNINEKKIQ